MDGFPFASLTGWMSNAASVHAMVIHIESRAINLPGHIRLPYPNTASSGFRTVGSKAPSLIKRSGLKEKGSG